MCRNILKLICNVSTNQKVYEPASEIGPSFLSLKGSILKLDNALALNKPIIILRRRIDLFESVRNFKAACKKSVLSRYEKKLIFLGDDLLAIADNLLQTSSLNLLSSVALQ